jgi:hypothetical protein
MGAKFMLTSRNEKMMHATNSHFATLKGITTHPVFASGGQLFWIVVDQFVVDNIVTAVKISDI